MAVPFCLVVQLALAMDGPTLPDTCVNAVCERGSLMNVEATNCLLPAVF